MNRTYHRLAFNALPQEVRMRITKACEGNGPPRSLAWSPDSGDRGLSFLFFGSGSGAPDTLSRGSFKFGLGIMLLALWGWWTWSFLSQPNVGTWFVVVPQHILVSVGLWLALAGYCRRRFRTVLPFSPGTYVFPTDVLVARGADIDVVPLESLLKSHALSVYRRGEYRGSNIMMTFRDYGEVLVAIAHRDGVDEFQEAIEAASDELRRAVAIHPADDVLHGGRGSSSSTVDGSEFLARPMGLWLRYYPITAFVLSLAATTLWLAKYVLSQ